MRVYRNNGSAAHWKWAIEGVSVQHLEHWSQAFELVRVHGYQAVALVTGDIVAATATGQIPDDETVAVAKCVVRITDLKNLVPN